MPSLRSRRSRLHITQRLEAEHGCDPILLEQLSWNALVNLAHDAGVLDEKEYEASLVCNTTVIKSYLWTFLKNQTHRDAVREYVMLCNRLQQRAYLTLKTAHYACDSDMLGNGNSEHELATALVTASSTAFVYLVLPEDGKNVNHPIRPIIDATRDAHPCLNDFADVPALVRIATKSGLNNTARYVGVKVRTAVYNHITVHLHRRVKQSMTARRINKETDVEGMMELFTSMKTDKVVGPDDRGTIIRLRRVFMPAEEADAEGAQVPPAPPTDPTHAMVMLHFECCRLVADTDHKFSAFPNASLKRCYQRLCNRLLTYVLKVRDTDDVLRQFFTTEGTRVKSNTKRNLKRKQRKETCTKRIGRHKRYRNGRWCLAPGSRVTSIETDGVGLSIVIDTEKSMPEYRSMEEHRPLTEKEKREYAQAKRKEEIERICKLADAIEKGLDPGRVNLYTTAQEKENMIPASGRRRGEQRLSTDHVGKDTNNADNVYERRFYSRERHLDVTGQKRMTAWRDERTRDPLVSEALKDLSLSGGAHCYNADRWTTYLMALHKHRATLWQEFQESEERCKKRMVAHRLGQRALARAADNLVMDGVLQKRPVIIAYGTGFGGACGGRGEASVPVKAMYKALMAAFRRHRIRGGVIDVWEHLTTCKCYKCEQRMATRRIPWNEKDVEKAEKKARTKVEVSLAEAARAREAGQMVCDPPPLLPPDPPYEHRLKVDRDFRICEQCSQTEQTRKLRNRDFNAAINILKLLQCELRGENRPEYLCPEKRARKKRVASTSCTGTQGEEEAVSSKVPKTRKPRGAIAYADTCCNDR